MKLFLYVIVLLSISLTQAMAKSKPNTTIYLQVPACATNGAIAEILIENGSKNIITVNEDCSTEVTPGASLPIAKPQCIKRA